MKPSRNTLAIDIFKAKARKCRRNRARIHNLRKMFKFGLGLATLSLSANAFSVTLPQVLQETIITHPLIHVAKNAKFATDSAVRSAYGHFLPNINISAGIGPEEFKNSNTGEQWKDSTRREGTLSIEENLFHGFSDVHRIREQHARRRAAIAHLNGVANDLALRVSEAYLSVIESQRLLGIANSALKAHTKIYRMLKDRAHSGLARQGDLSQVESRVALARSNVISAKSHYRAAVANYTAITGHAPHQLSNPTSPRHDQLPHSLESAVTLATTSHPFLSAADADIRAKREVYLGHRGVFMPSIDMDLAAQRNRNTNDLLGKNDNNYAMVRASLNLFHGGQDYQSLKTSAYQLNEAKAERNNIYRDVSAQIKLAWAALVSAKEALPFLKKHKHLSNLTRQHYMDQYQIGKRTLLDLLNAENEYFTASEGLVKASFDLTNAKYRVLHSTNQLLSFFHASLNRPSIRQQ